MSSADITSSPIVPVERLTELRDRFRCEKLHCTLSAQGCLYRQKRALIGDADNGLQPRSLTYGSCYQCPVGFQVRERFPAVTIERPRSGRRFPVRVSPARIAAFRRHADRECLPR